MSIGTVQLKDTFHVIPTTQQVWDQAVSTLKPLIDTSSYKTTITSYLKANDKTCEHADSLSCWAVATLPEIRYVLAYIEQAYEHIVLEVALNNIGVSSDIASIIVSDKGRVVTINSSAQVLLDDGSVLGAKQNHLYATDSLDNNALSSLLAKSLGNNGEPTPGYALVGGSQCVNEYQVLAFPIKQEKPPLPWMELPNMAVLVIIEPTRQVSINPEILKTLYHMTPAEIDLVNAMINGIKPVQYAAKMNKSVPTVQSQRQAVFRKVNVSNQLELMNVLRNLTVLSG